MIHSTIPEVLLLKSIEGNTLLEYTVISLMSAMVANNKNSYLTDIVTICKNTRKYDII